MLRRGATQLLGLSQLGSNAQLGALSQVREMAKVAYVPKPAPGGGKKHKVVLIPGDGVGPEVTAAVQEVIAAMNAPISWDVYNNVRGLDKAGNPATSVPAEVLDAIRKYGICLKGTLFTPLSRSTSTQSLNVQMRKDLDLYMNMVHGFNLPNVKTRHNDLDIVVIRENTEGEYSGLEHEVVPGVVESLKVVTWKNSLRIAEYAFDYAYLNNREKVTAVHKANIIKLSDGEFLKACRAVAAKYPKIQYEEMIVDNTCMQLVSKPEQFDVMVTPNFYGNLVANIVAGLVGGPGICPGSNVGEGIAVFEQGARHVAKDLADKGVANPTAMMLSSAMMLRSMGLDSFSDRLESAVFKVYSDNNPTVLTPDVGGTGNIHSFVRAVISHLDD